MYFFPTILIEYFQNFFLRLIIYFQMVIFHQFSFVPIYSTKYNKLEMLGLWDVRAMVYLEIYLQRKSRPFSRISTFWIFPNQLNSRKHSLMMKSLKTPNTTQANSKDSIFIADTLFRNKLLETLNTLFLNYSMKNRNKSYNLLIIQKMKKKPRKPQKALN